MAKSVGSKSTMKMQPETTYAETPPDPSKTTITMEIIWTERTAKVKDLKPYDRNPRKLTKAAFERLTAAIQKLGFHQRLLCTPDLRVIGGHARIRALKSLKIKEVQILVPNRQLTEQEFKQLLISDNGQFGEWDMDILSADFEIDELVDLGVPEALLNFQPVTPDESNSESEAEEPAPSDLTITITCESMAQKQDLLDEFLRRGITCKE